MMVQTDALQWMLASANMCKTHSLTISLSLDVLLSDDLVRAGKLLDEAMELRKKYVFVKEQLDQRTDADPVPSTTQVKYL